MDEDLSERLHDAPIGIYANGCIIMSATGSICIIEDDMLWQTFSKRICIYNIYFIYLHLKSYNRSEMRTAINIKRKNIDLPVDVLQKLSLMAVAQGKSLKAYIENLLIAKANSVTIEVSENPSPSGDEWFADANNIAEVEEGIRQHKEGRVKTYSIDEIKNLLGV